MAQGPAVSEADFLDPFMLLALVGSLDAFPRAVVFGLAGVLLAAAIPIARLIAAIIADEVGDPPQEARAETRHISR